MTKETTKKWKCEKCGWMNTSYSSACLNCHNPKSAPPQNKEHHNKVFIETDKGIEELTPSQSKKQCPFNHRELPNCDVCEKLGCNHTPPQSDWGKQECEHEIGRKLMGGFAGHEHTHPTGEQYCFNCGKTLAEIIQKAKEEALKEVEKKFKEFTKFGGEISNLAIGHTNGKGKWEIILKRFKSFISAQIQQATENYAKEVIPKLNEKWRKRIEQARAECRAETLKEVEKEIDKMDRSVFDEVNEHEFVDTCDLYKMIQALNKNLAQNYEKRA